MIKYLQYFASPLTLFLAIYFCSQGTYSPTLFFIGFSLLIIFGDMFLGKNDVVEKYTYPSLLNLALYINLPLLYILVFLVIFIFSNPTPMWIVDIITNYFAIDIIHIKNSFSILDKISFIALTSLFIGAMGTVPGHELTHRKRNPFDMFIGNWLLALSWDCAFAIEHVYGHHKNVCLPDDPATAKRGENIYAFIIRAIIKEQRDAWVIEMDRLKRRKYKFFTFHNKMLLGYLRSITITILAYIIGGVMGMCFYLLCAFIGKSLLEVINYTEHYGLIREFGKPVHPRHSWNSNNIMSSIYLYNVTRHSSHHETANLKYWELDTYPDAPMMSQGYLFMLYIVIFFPHLYHNIMAKKLIEWDRNYASEEERVIAKSYNKASGIALLQKEY